jgi:hypothetical protein
MPRKIRALIKNLEKAGWVLHHFAHHYQEKLVKEAVSRARRKS